MCEFELPLWGRQVQQSVAWTVLEVAAGSVLLGQEHTVLSDCLESHPAGGAYDGRPDGGPIL